MNLNVYKLNEDAVLPTRNLFTDAGVDLYCLEDVFLPVNTTTKVNTGIAVEIQSGFVGKIENRSSMSLKGLQVGAGVVDSGFTGELCVVVHNLNNTESFQQDPSTFRGYQNQWNKGTNSPGYWMKKGTKIAQLLVYKVELPSIVEVDELWTSERGSNGFGSSGQ